MTKIGSIYVEVSGDFTQYQKDLKKLRTDARSEGVAISNALNNAITPQQAVKSITVLSDNLTKLSNVAKTPAASFKKTSEAVAADLGAMAKKAGLTEKQFAKLNERMLKKAAAQNAQRSLKSIATAADLSEKEIKKLAQTMGFNSAEAKKMASAISKTDKQSNKFIKTLAGIASGALAYVTVRKLKDAFVDLTQVGMSFESQMKRVQGLSGANDEQFKQLTDTARELGETTEHSATAAGQSFEYLALAGFSVSQQIGALPGILDLATSSQLELGRASDIATDTLGAFGLMVDDTAKLQENLTRVTDVMSKATQKSNTDMEQLFETFVKVGPAATSLGADIETVSALTGALANSGTKASDAGTHLKTMFVNLAAQTPKATEQLEKLGVSVQDSEGKFRDIIDILEDLDKSMEGMTDSQRAEALKDIFGKIPFSSVNILMAEGADRLRELRTEMDNATGTTKTLAEMMRDTAEGDLKGFQSALEGIKIDIFEEYKEEIRGALQQSTQYLREHKDEILEFVKILGESLTWAVKRMENFSRSILILNKVKEGELAFWKAATMGPKEAAAWLKKYHEEQKTAPLATLKAQIDLQTKILSNEKLNAENRKKHTQLLKEAEDEYKKLAGVAEKANKGIGDAAKKTTKDVEEGLKKQTRAQERELEDQQKRHEETEREKTDTLRKELDGRIEGLEDFYYVDEAYAADQNVKLIRLQEERAAKEDKIRQDKLDKEAEYWNDVYDAGADAIGSLVDAYIAGEDMKVAAQKLAADMMVDQSKEWLAEALPLLIGGIAKLLGVELGYGFGKAANGGKEWTEMLGQGALYLAGAGAGILAGKALANSSFAGGGWLAKHPTGGMITEGSGFADDVFLGMTHNNTVANYGMGNEYVINKKSTAKYLPILEAINQDRPEFAGFADGGEVGPQKTEAEIYDMASSITNNTLMAFIQSYLKSGEVWNSIAQAIVFFAANVGGMLSSKLFGEDILADLFLADGGAVGGGKIQKRGFGWFDDFTDIFEDGNDILDDLGIDFGLNFDLNDFLEDIPNWMDAGMFSNTVQGTNQLLVPFVRDIVSPDRKPDPIDGLVSAIKVIWEEGIIRTFEDALDPFGIFGVNESGTFFANGAIVTGATPAIFGENGAEAAVPLHLGKETLKVMHDDIKRLANRPVKIELYFDERSQKYMIKTIADEVSYVREVRGLNDGTNSQRGYM